MAETADKESKGKLRFSLLPIEAVREIIKVFEFGAKKYSDFNWRKGCEWSKYYDATQRHLTAYWNNENTDAETRLLHLAHAGCCVLILLTFQVVGIGKDDRWKG